MRSYIDSRPLINELTMASGQTFSEPELTKLWKLNFAKHINAKEATVIKVHHSDYINSTEWAAIQEFGKGIFDFNAINKLFTQMGTTLPERWKPDNEVKS